MDKKQINKRLAENLKNLGDLKIFDFDKSKKLTEERTRLKEMLDEIDQKELNKQIDEQIKKNKGG